MTAFINGAPKERKQPLPTARLLSDQVIARVVAVCKLMADDLGLGPDMIPAWFVRSGDSFIGLGNCGFRLGRPGPGN